MRPRAVIPASGIEAPASLQASSCTKHGWCLSEDDWNALIAGPPEDRDALAEAIVRAEFGEAGHERLAWLQPIVNDWLFAPAGRGARSGHPL